MSQTNHQNLWDRIWKNKDGHVVIFQMPNVWLIGWAGLALVSIFVPRDSIAQQIMYWISSGLLVIWAGLEIFKGTNYFRRGLGLVVLLMVLSAIRMTAMHA